MHDHRHSVDSQTLECSVKDSLVLQTPELVHHVEFCVILS